MLFIFLPFIVGKRNICIDPGFGMNTNAQSVSNFLISREICKEIQKESDYQPYLIRTNEITTPYINTRFSFANYMGCDLVLTMKRNALDQKANGIEARVSTLYSENDLLLRGKLLNYTARIENSNVLSATLVADEGVQTYSMGPSSVLFLLFYTDARDQALFNEYYKEYAKLIAKACIDSINSFE